MLYLLIRLAGMEATVSWFCHHDDKEVSRSYLDKVSLAPSFLGLGGRQESREPITLITVQCKLCKRYKQTQLYGHLRPVE